MHFSRFAPLVSYFAALVAGSAVVKRQTNDDGSDGACTHGSDTRWCWGDGFTIAADFDKKWPTTGHTVNYEWDITNTTKDLDGTGEKMVFLINNQYPGPTLYANWGDTIQVKINNKLENNGTGIHWHGLRQLNSVEQDGVPGITECPIAPGESRVYTFKATQYGTSWYHSHWSVQYGQGIVGTIVINGPASDNYDEDLGTLPITEMYDITAFQGMYRARARPPVATNGLINGSMVSPGGQTGGAYAKTTITHGKRYRIRIINTSVDSHWLVSLDGHPFTVISSDFTPIKPYTANWLAIAIGQRYDVIIEANQNPGNYWFRADVPNGGCGNNNNNGSIRSIFHYSDANNDNPTSTALSGRVDKDKCTDETQIEPYWDSFVPSDPLSALPEILNVSAAATGVFHNDDGTNATLFRWGIDFSSINVDWDKPTLEYVQEGNTSYPASFNLIHMPPKTNWTYWVLQEVTGPDGTILPAAHPIHLHGHDFYVLGSDVGIFTKDISLNFVNPPRRDTSVLPAGGWMVMAFQADNPGAWIMHCHIAWHVSDGLAAQFLESPDKITVSSEFNDVCEKWRGYYPEKALYLKDDSGV